MVSCRRRLSYAPVSAGVLTAVSLVLLLGCSFPGQQSNIPKVQVQLRNPLALERQGVPVVLTLDQVKQVATDFALQAYVVADPANSSEHIPSQAEDTDYDGVLDTLVFLVDMVPAQTRELVIHYEPQEMQFTLGYDKQTRAGIFPELGGPVIESEPIAYRVLPGNIVDVLGKQDAGYLINAWVDEVRQGIELPSLLGKGLVGCGSFRLWDRTDVSEYHSRVLVNGPVRSTVQLVGDGFVADLSVYAGRPWIEYRIKASAEVAAMLPGMVDLVRNEADGFAYTWGQQTTYEAQDSLGLALFYSPGDLASIEESLEDLLTPDRAHYLVLKPGTDGVVEYRALATWDHDHQAIQDEAAFVKQLKATAELLQNPLEVVLSLPVDDSKKEK